MSCYTKEVMGLILTLLILSVIAGFVIGLFVWYQNKTSFTHIFFLLFTSSSSILSTINIISLNQETSTATLDLARWAIFVAILYSLTLFLMIHTFPGKSLKLSPAKLTSLLLISGLVLVLTRTSLIFADIVGTGANSKVVPGPAIPLFALTTGSLILGAITILIRRYRSSSGLLKAQLQTLLLGVVISSLLLFITNFVFVVVLKNASFLVFSPAYFLIFSGFTAYAILAHQLFDIRVIIKRTLVYSGLLLCATIAYSMIIFFFAALFGEQQVFTARTFVANLIAASIIAIIFEPLRRWLVSVTDKYLFVGEYNAQAVTAQLAETLSSVLDLDEALQTMMTVLTRALRVREAAVFILQTDPEKGLIMRRVQAVGYRSVTELTLQPNARLLSYFSEKHNSLIVTEELKQQSDAGRQPNPGLVELVQTLDRFQAAIAVPIRVGDKLIGILVMGPKLSGDVYSANDLQFLDVAAKQTAAAIEKSRFYEDDQLKSEFVSIASHELLTPTAAIEGYLSMILDEKMAQVDPKAEEYLRKVQSSAHRLGELVADLLSVSRIEGGRIVVNKQPIEVSPIIQSVTDELKVKADQAGIKLVYLAPAQPLPKALADPDRVAQIVTNLISNAIKYNRPNGSIELSAQTNGRMIIVSVKDSGIGIDAKHLPHLFEKFYRVQDDTAAAEKIGTGLGLYITRSIVELQGGKIGVQSQPGVGSLFSFSLPLAESTGQPLK